MSIENLVLLLGSEDCEVPACGRENTAFCLIGSHITLRERNECPNVNNIHRIIYATITGSIYYHVVHQIHGSVKFSLK